MSPLKDFELYIAARDVMERVREHRMKGSFGIAVDTDKYALDYQAAECVARVTEHSVRMACGQNLDYSICPYCGWDTGRCYCDTIKERGIDTHNIRFADGLVYYNEARHA